MFKKFQMVSNYIKPLYQRADSTKAEMLSFWLLSTSMFALNLNFVAFANIFAAATIILYVSGMVVRFKRQIKSMNKEKK